MKKILIFLALLFTISLVQAQSKLYNKSWDKIGYYEDGKIYNKSWDKIGYCEDGKIYNKSWDKIGYYEDGGTKAAAALAYLLLF